MISKHLPLYSGKRKRAEDAFPKTPKPQKYEKKKLRFRNSNNEINTEIYNEKLN